MTYTFEEFKEKLRSFCWSVSEDEARMLHTITVRLDECSKKFNLTAIKEPEEVLKKHIIDSLHLSRALCSYPLYEKELLDVGSGAGFPSLPVAALLSETNITAMDATAKKVEYMNETAKIAGMENFRAVCARAEEAGSPSGVFREKFDFVTARAVASLNVLFELCVPMLKVGGYFIAMKGSAAEEEMAEAEAARKKLSCTLCEIIPYSLPITDDKRFLLVYRKDSATPSVYPRNFSQISKKPL